MKPLLHHVLRSVRSFFCLLSLTALAATARADDGPYALSFDGVDDHVAVPHSVLFNNSQLSATAWIKTSQATGEPGLINKYVAASFNGWQVFLFNGEVRAWFFRDNANFIWDGGRGLNGGFVANGQWHHVAFTVDPSGGRLYVDGVLRDSRSWTGTPGNATTAQELRLGSYPGSGFYNGLIDEVTVWSKGLTLPEILAGRSNSLTGYERELRGYFRLTEGSGTSVRNSAYSGPFVPGALVNGPTWVPGVVLKPGVMTLPQFAVTSGSAWLNGLASAGQHERGAPLEQLDGSGWRSGNRTGPVPAYRAGAEEPAPTLLPRPLALT